MPELYVRIEKGGPSLAWRMTGAERAALETERQAFEGQLAELEARLARVPYGGPDYHQAQQNLRGRIRRLQQQIGAIDARLNVGTS